MANVYGPGYDDKGNLVDVNAAFSQNPAFVSAVKQNPSSLLALGGNDLGSALNTILNGVLATPVKTPTMPPLNFQFPSSADINSKWNEFITKAQSDPDIVNYYKNLLDFTKGDLDLAKNYIERDYALGVRHSLQNVTSSIEALTGVTFPREQEELASNLNERGIAVTDQGGGKVGYAQGGQAGTELGRLTESQNLRKEAEMRSKYQQPLEKAQLQREKSLSDVGQQGYYSALQQGYQKQKDILARAQQSYNVWQAGQNADLTKAQQQQQNQIAQRDPNRGDTELDMLAKMNRNPIQEERYQKLLKSGEVTYV